MILEEFQEGIVDQAIVFHNTLNPLLWNNQQLKPLIRLALLKIAKDFVAFIGIDFKVVDITISGSNAAYTYTPNSDLDLHIIADIPQAQAKLYKQLFDAKKNQYNYLHNLTVKGIDVELYVQDSRDTHHSAGIYSIKNSRWISEPKVVKVRISDQDVRRKVNNYLGKISSALGTDDLDYIDSVQSSIKKLRQTGLDREGEFSVENLAFKVLRANGWIDRLREHKYNVQSEILSVENMK
jgi:hypothetical protein